MGQNVEPHESDRHKRTHGLRFQSNTSYLLAMAGARCRQRWVAMLRQFDINPSQYKVLMCLAELGSQGQRQLAELISVDQRNCVPIVKSLTQRHLVARNEDESDRRRRLLSLTQAGRALTGELVAIGDQIAADMLRPLDPDEQAVLRQMLVEVLDDESY